MANGVAVLRIMVIRRHSTLTCSKGRGQADQFKLIKHEVIKRKKKKNSPVPELRDNFVWAVGSGFSRKVYA